MKNIAIFLNFSKEHGLKIANEIITSLKEKGFKLYSSKDYFIDGTEGFCSGNLPENVELLLVLGGDGTFLSVAREYAGYQVPILGVNLGTLGFLTEVELKEVEDAIEKIDKGQYNIEKRQMVEAQLIRDGEIIEKVVALNEITISKGPLARIISLNTYVDDVFLECYPGDGVIISTPTGSTGYSLSAGGPILTPALPVLVITPICPHTLHSRSVVVSNKSEIKVILTTTNQEVVLTIDGQKGIGLKSGDVIKVKGSDLFVPVVRLKGKNFFDILRLKMNNYSNRRLL
ncbi:NAD(+)/NADH kinase [Anaerobranca gottschalkii]|uniref:NAD kinase n=1 Tax=Anaerobranca gottschalkii DSM 13577 TaxID=1120990 RepID=A0A1H9Y206_9FIRM|nr:NAD(+)/NADH kinase [Anaerobranca gottschalkii]SES62742.1 NAD+ kinase [Anaerobranca gottschalkii DSM 13577]